MRDDEDADRAPGDFDIELLDGADIMVREALRADEEILIVEYALTRPEAEADTVIRLAWPELHLSDTTFAIPDRLPPTDP